MKEININGQEYVLKKGVKKEFSFEPKEIELPFEVGKSYFIRTVTYHLVGKVKEIKGKFLELQEASWIADSGRFMNAILEGKLDEVEPVGLAGINTDAIVDYFPWNHKLPDKQK